MNRAKVLTEAATPQPCPEADPDFLGFKGLDEAAGTDDDIFWNKSLRAWACVREQNWEEALEAFAQADAASNRDALFDPYVESWWFVLDVSKISKSRPVTSFLIQDLAPRLHFKAPMEVKKRFFDSGEINGDALLGRPSKNVIGLLEGSEFNLKEARARLFGSFCGPRLKTLPMAEEEEEEKEKDDSDEEEDEEPEKHEEPDKDLQSAIYAQRDVMRLIELFVFRRRMDHYRKKREFKMACACLHRSLLAARVFLMRRIQLGKQDAFYRLVLRYAIRVGHCYIRLRVDMITLLGILPDFNPHIGDYAQDEQKKRQSQSWSRWFRSKWNGFLPLRQEEEPFVPHQVQDLAARPIDKRSLLC